MTVGAVPASARLNLSRARGEVRSNRRYRYSALPAAVIEITSSRLTTNPDATQSQSLASPCSLERNKRSRMAWNPHSRFASAPWYVMAWRLLWSPVIELLRGIFLLAVLIGWGPRLTKEIERATSGE